VNYFRSVTILQRPSPLNRAVVHKAAFAVNAVLVAMAAPRVNLSLTPIHFTLSTWLDKDSFEIFDVVRPGIKPGLSALLARPQLTVPLNAAEQQKEC